MMNIEESNLIVKDVIYSNLTNKRKTQKNTDEFGYFQYYIHPKFNPEKRNLTIYQ
jgi:hypothetical protein